MGKTKKKVRLHTALVKVEIIPYEYCGQQLYRIKLPADLEVQHTFDQATIDSLWANGILRLLK